MDVQGLTPEQAATRVTEAFGVMQPPVPVIEIARQLGLRVGPMDVADDVSGMLVADGGAGVIGYNRGHSPTRRRFTVAHELGHYLLHRGRLPLFIDKRYIVAFRDERSSKGDVRWEREANAFASALLMPKPLVMAAVEEVGFDCGLDLGGEGALRMLANRFGVSQEAMSYRLARLGLFMEPGF